MKKTTKHCIKLCILCSLTSSLLLFSSKKAEKTRAIDAPAFTIDNFIERIKEKDKLNIYCLEHGLRGENGFVDHLNKTEENKAFMNIGDCFIVTYNDIEILVDAGLGTDNAKNELDLINGSKDVVNIMDKIVDDTKVWDYCIFTHGHADHIEGVPSIIAQAHLKGISFSNVFDFGISDEINDSTYPSVTSMISQRYISTITNLVNNFDCNHYGVASFYSDDGKPISGRPIEIKHDDFSLRFLYNKFLPITSQNLDKNLQSVCFLIQYKEQKMLFTGDLGELGGLNNGESELFKNNYEYLKDGVTFFKAAHHGSRTANSAQFINNIHPNYVIIPAVAGSDQKFKSGSSDLENHVFPSMTTANNFFDYTDYIFIPSVALNDKNGSTYDYKSYYGDILLQFDGENTEYYTSANSVNGDVEKLISSTDWFTEKRKIDFSIRNFVDNSPQAWQYNCTLYKFGHYDVLIDCGSSDIMSKELIEDVKKHVVDGVIELLVVTNDEIEKISTLVGDIDVKTKKPKNNGLLSQIKVEKMIDFGNKTNIKLGDSDYPLFNAYRELTKSIPHLSFNDNGVCDYTLTTVETFFKNHRKNIDLDIEVIDSSNAVENDTNNYSLTTLVKFGESKALFVGDRNDFTNLIHNYENDIKNCTYFKASGSNTHLANSSEMLKIVNPTVCVINGSVKDYQRDYMTNKEDTYAIVANCDNIYFTSVIENGCKTAYSGEFGTHINPLDSTDVVSKTDDDKDALKYTFNLY